MIYKGICAKTNMKHLLHSRKSKTEKKNIFARFTTKMDILRIEKVFTNQWENLNKSTEKRAKISTIKR